MDIITTHIPKIRAKDANTPPWIDAEVLHLLKKKESARRAAKKSKNIAHHDKFRALRKESKTLIDLKFKEYTKSLGESIKENPKRFWRYFRCKTKSNSIPTSIKYNNRTFTSARDKAEAFNKYFFTTFTEDNDVLPASNNTRSDVPQLVLPTLSESEVHQVLSQLDPYKAPGPDGIPTLILKECSRELSPSVCHLFNLSLSSGKLPQEWKKSLVAPVFKKGRKEDVENYRSISLLCAISKVLERCICNYLRGHFKTILDDSQHGFVKGRSTVTQLLSFYHKVGQSLDNGSQIDIVFLDLK